MNSSRPTVVQMGEGNLVLSPYLVSDDNFVNVVELIPVLIIFKLISVQGLELWTPRDRNVQSLCSIKALLVKQIEVVLVN